MLRRLPPLNALKAFEAAARSESITRAAEELGVTPGAVSQHVKALEATLGIKLFNRERQRLIITEAGRQYFAVVRDALDRIAVGTERLVQRQTSEHVLDRLPEGGIGNTEDRHISRLAAGGGRRRRSPPQSPRTPGGREMNEVAEGRWSTADSKVLRVSYQAAKLGWN